MNARKINLLSLTVNKMILVNKADSALNSMTVSLLKHDEYFGDDDRGLEEGLCCVMGN